jgi:hypothetical protein
MEVETFFHLVGTQSEQDTGFPQAVRVQEFGIVFLTFPLTPAVNGACWRNFVLMTSA